MKKIFGLLGNPIQHSLSPRMHNAAFFALGLKAEYKLFERAPEEFEDFLAQLSQEYIEGFNVTYPYKERIIPKLAKLSDEARLINAVNTVKVTAGGLVGYNTDGEGFIKHLTSDLRFDPRGKRVALLGAGGAAKAVAVYLGIARVSSMHIFDSDAQKVLALIVLLKQQFRDIDFKAADSIKALEIDKTDLLINATPVGMKHVDPCLVDEKYMHSGQLVYDLIYHPRETKLLTHAEGRGALISNGLGMLLHQGIKSFEIFTGVNAPLAAMRQALLKSEQ